MPINVSEAIDSDTAVIVPLENSTGGYVDGIYQKATTTVTMALASVQQPTPKQLEFLEGGERVKDIKSFYLNKEVKEADDDGPETVITHRGQRYKVVFAGDWQDFGWFFAMGAREK